MATKRKLRTSAKCTQAVIWSRVSSAKQSDGASLSAQESKNKAYCKDKNFKVIKTFSVIESSTKEKRPEFEKMLEYVTSQKKKTAIVCYCVDRFQRNNNPDQIVNKLISEDKIELHFSNGDYKINLESANGENMRHDVDKLSSKWYIENMKVAQERSIVANLNNGVYISCAPIGYSNCRLSKRKSVVQKNEETAPKVVILFKEYATGKHSLATLTELAANMGLVSQYSINNKPLTKQSIHAILKNKFYCGYMQNVDGIYIKHTSGGIISEELFNKVQNVLTGRKENNVKTSYKSIPFAFRGLIRCKCCGRVLNTERHYIKAEGREVNYLRCATPRKHCDQKPIREEVIFNVLKQEVFASSLELTDKMKKALKASLKKALTSEIDSAKTIKSSISKQINELRSQDDILAKSLISGRISEDKYDKFKAEIDANIAKLEAESNRYIEVGQQMQQKFETIFATALDISKLIVTASPDKQNQLLSLLFESCELNGTNFKYSLRRPFDRLLLAPKSKDWIALNLETLSTIDNVCDDITGLDI